MNAGFDQVFNMINDSVISVIDILDTYVYRIGILNGQYAYATAASLFKGVIGVILILSTHFISKKLVERECGENEKAEKTYLDDSHYLRHSLSRFTIYPYSNLKSTGHVIFRSFKSS